MIFTVSAHLTQQALHDCICILTEAQLLSSAAPSPVFRHLFESDADTARLVITDSAKLRPLRKDSRVAISRQMAEYVDVRDHMADSLYSFAPMLQLFELLPVMIRWPWLAQNGRCILSGFCDHHRDDPCCSRVRIPKSEVHSFGSRQFPFEILKDQVGP